MEIRETIARLKGFWSGEGVVELPPCALELPAAGLHPQIFLRLLVAEPWKALALHPVSRPLDARHGEHPDRLGRHLQVSVVHKPPAEDVPGLLRRSLRALGLDLAEHDLVLEPLDWRQPAFDARGRGWRVWLDGLGIARISFLERAAGLGLEPPAVELAFGVERLALAAGGERGIFELGWSGQGLGYGALRRREEAELSRRSLEIADGARLLRRLEELEAEGRLCLEAGLVYPTYEVALGCLALIDQLEARRVLMGWERRPWVERVRRLVVGLGRELRPAPAGEEDGDGEA